LLRKHINDKIWKNISSKVGVSGNKLRRRNKRNLSIKEFAKEDMRKELFKLDL
jgi:hypothetical protein